MFVISSPCMGLENLLSCSQDIHKLGRMVCQVNSIQIIAHTPLLSRITIILSSACECVPFRLSEHKFTHLQNPPPPRALPGEFKTFARWYNYKVLRFVISTFALLRWVQKLLTLPCFRTFPFCFLTLGREMPFYGYEKSRNTILCFFLFCIFFPP
jgi:hypothetical protein